MKRGTLLHPELSRVIARLGHGDALVIADAGLPIPAGVELVSHDELKRLSQGARAIVRTGEFTPYANAVLFSGVVF